MELFEQLVSQYGYIAVFIASMADHTGTPGAVLLSVGAATGGYLSLWPVLFVSALGGLAGDLILYFLGAYGGSFILNQLLKRKPDFEPAKQKLFDWFEQYGGSLVLWARFIAVIGRYASFVLGMVKYNVLSFILLSFIGNLIMVLVFGLPVYYLGQQANTFFQSDTFTFNFTIIVVIGQIILTGLYYKIKSKR